MKKKLLSLLFAGLFSSSFAPQMQAETSTKTTIINCARGAGSFALATAAAKLIRLGITSGICAITCFKNIDSIAKEAYIDINKAESLFMLAIIWDLGVPMVLVATSAGFALVSAACFAGGAGSAIGAYALWPSETHKTLCSELCKKA